MVYKAKLCLADSIACMVGGVDLAPSKILLKVLSSSSQGSVALPGISTRLGLLDAAYYGAQTANALDFDDDLIGHPGATVNPIALAVGQLSDVDGRHLLSAIVAGYEVSVRIAEAIMPTYERAQTVFGFSTWQTFGALVSAAKLLSLSGAEIENAMGLAGAQAPVPNVRKFIDGNRASSWIKNAYGIAGRIGVLSAQLAADGYVGNRNIFDGPSGFWIMSGSDQFRRELAVNGLGYIWKITDVNFKAYACCYWLQTMLDAAESLRGVLEVAAVKSIEIHAFREISVRFGGALPNSIFEAQFHAPYLAALQLLDRSPAQGLREEDLFDPKVIALAQKVTLLHDPEMDCAFRHCDLYPVRIVARDKVGSFKAFVERPRAAEKSSEVEDLVRRKFLSILSVKLGKQATIDAWNMIYAIENHSVNDLMKILGRESTEIC